MTVTSTAGRRSARKHLILVTPRTIEWRPFLAGTVLALLIVGGPAAAHVTLSAANLAMLLRLSALCCALGAAFVLDDPAAGTVTATPLARMDRNLARVLWIFGATAVTWAAVLGVNTVTAGVSHVRVPIGGLSLEAATMLATALAIAAVSIRVRPAAASAGVTAASALTVIAIGAAMLPARLSVLPDPGEPHWTGAHLTWAVAFVVAVVAMLAMSWDRVRSRY